jgi:hypothetical protein
MPWTCCTLSLHSFGEVGLGDLFWHGSFQVTMCEIGRCVVRRSVIPRVKSTVYLCVWRQAYRPTRADR